MADDFRRRMGLRVVTENTRAELQLGRPITTADSRCSAAMANDYHCQETAQRWPRASYFRYADRHLIYDITVSTA